MGRSAEERSDALVSDHLVPHVADATGYCMRCRDLSFLGIPLPAVDAWRSRARPLGLSQIQYDALVEELWDALERDGVPADGCDVRLKGSSAAFFSGLHKRMPVQRDEIIDIFRDLRARYPSTWEIAEINRRLHDEWIVDGEFPNQRPFDAMFRLGIETEPSDVDLQISSDVLADRCEAVIVEQGQDPTEARFKHPVYNFVRKDLVERVCPHLFLFSRRMTDALRRHLSLAVFPACGPPNVSKTHGELSAHFKGTDWILQDPGKSNQGNGACPS